MSIYLLHSLALFIDYWTIIINKSIVLINILIIGFNFVRIRYLGEKYVLMSCEEEGIIEKAIAKNKDWFDNIFGSLVPWNDPFVVSKKFVWVRCRGISLSLWNSKCFERIGALVGTLVEVDKATTAREV